MEKSLLNIKNFCVFTFSTTSHALKAEKVLKSLQAKFVVMPTLREISTSCGLSIKIDPENVQNYYAELVDRSVVVEGVYQVEKEGSQKQIVKITQ